MLEDDFRLQLSARAAAWSRTERLAGKANTGWRCDGCGQDLRYEPAQLQKVLRRAERAQGMNVRAVADHMATAGVRISHVGVKTAPAGEREAA